jgi:hypothetical protein
VTSRLGMGKSATFFTVTYVNRPGSSDICLGSTIRLSPKLPGTENAVVQIYSAAASNRFIKNIRKLVAYKQYLIKYFCNLSKPNQKVLDLIIIYCLFILFLISLFIFILYVICLFIYSVYVKHDYKSSQVIRSLVLNV